jgi:translation initiation factor IF-1
MPFRFWNDGEPQKNGDRVTVTVVEYDTSETGAGPFDPADATGRTFTASYDTEKENITDIIPRLRAKRDADDVIRTATTNVKSQVNTWLTNNDL